MRVEHIYESTTSVISLSEKEAYALKRVGARLASDKRWWGAKTDQPDRTVIQCNPQGGVSWSIRVQDAVGLISVGDLQIVIEPKIPVKHLMFLFSKSQEFPRLDDQPTTAAADTGLLELIARWFLRAAASLFRKDLIRDYSEAEEALQAVRGQIDALPTARAFYVGRLEFYCRFEEFLSDTPLNRLIKAAARLLRRSPVFSEEVRRKASRIVAHLSDVSELHQADLSAKIDRRTSYYADTVLLAKQILRSIGRSVDLGTQSAWTFLIRTPELVEAGIRAILTDSLSSAAVCKRGQQLRGSSMTVNPDLLFSAGAVGDVKYKVWDGKWNRSDLYEVVAFATAFRLSHALLIDFAESALDAQPIHFGNVCVQRFSWLYSLHDPLQAAGKLCDCISAWILELTEISVS